MLLYCATIKRDADTFVVFFPDIPLAHTNGESQQDALHTAISMLMERSMDVPDRANRGAGMQSW